MRINGSTPHLAGIAVVADDGLALLARALATDGASMALVLPQTGRVERVAAVERNDTVGIVLLRRLGFGAGPLLLLLLLLLGRGLVLLCAALAATMLPPTTSGWRCWADPSREI